MLRPAAGSIPDQRCRGSAPRGRSRLRGGAPTSRPQHAAHQHIVLHCNVQIKQTKLVASSLVFRGLCISTLKWNNTIFRRARSGSRRSKSQDSWAGRGNPRTVARLSLNVFLESSKLQGAGPTCPDCVFERRNHTIPRARPKQAAPIFEAQISCRQTEVHSQNLVHFPRLKFLILAVSIHKQKLSTRCESLSTERYSSRK